jgi:hypothetical protein
VTVKRVKVSVYHSFDLDVPDDLLDEDSWALSGFVYDAFIDDEDNWDDFGFDIRDIKERN